MPVTGIPPRAGAHRVAQSQVLCRAAVSLPLQASHERHITGWEADGTGLEVSHSK